MTNNNNKLRIIFLDLDGVISTPDYHWHLDPNKVALLEEIIKATDAKIVVSSSWRVGCKDINDFIDKIFGRWRLQSGNLEHKSIMVNAMYDITDTHGSTRGDEIKRWLDAHKDEVESYVILDDDIDMLDEQLFNFVGTDCYEGITSREVKLCIQVLKKEKIANPLRLNLPLLFKWYDRNSGRESNIDELLYSYHAQYK